MGRNSLTPLVSVVVCTYNRADLLRTCLESLVVQTADKSLYEVIVVNNNSTDTTIEAAAKFVKSQPNFRMVTETKQGLSYARNRGYIEAKTDWVAYLDDDAKAFSNYVERILYVIQNYNFDCFGGIYLPWFKYGKPKWFPENFGTNGQKLKQIGILENDYASGGVIVFKKLILEHFGGFSTSIGMKGNNIGYGEETLLQVKMRKKGFIIGFDPELRIEHLIADYKLTPFWFIRSAFAHGRDSWLIFEYDINLFRMFKILCDMGYNLIKNLLCCTPKLCRQDYYIQNWIIDVMRPLAFGCAQFVGVINRK